MPRARVRARVLVIVAVALAATTVATVVADSVLRSRIESELASTDTPVELTLGGGSVLWSYLTGTMHVDAHLDAEAMRDAITAKAGIGIGDVTMTGGTIVATLDSGLVTALFGGDVAIELAPRAVDGVLSVAISGLTVGGEERADTSLADRFGPFVIDPATVTGCAAASAVTVDDADVRDDELVISLSVPNGVAGELADCR
jgi:hypothetical protein